MQKKSFCLEKNSFLFTLKRDHDYCYQAQQQIHTTGRDYWQITLYESLWHDVIHNYIGEQARRLAYRESQGNQCC